MALSQTVLFGTEINLLLKNGGGYHDVEEQELIYKYFQLVHW